MSLFGLGKTYKPMEDASLLVTVYDFGERAFIESVLRDADIAYLVKERGGSVPVITGSSVFGTDIFVRSADLEAARTLILPPDEAENTAQADGAEEK